MDDVEKKDCRHCVYFRLNWCYLDENHRQISLYYGPGCDCELEGSNDDEEVCQNFERHV